MSGRRLAVVAVLAVVVTGVAVFSAPGDDDSVALRRPKPPTTPAPVEVTAVIEAPVATAPPPPPPTTARVPATTTTTIPLTPEQHVARVVAQSPPASCLVVRRGDAVVTAHRPDAGLVPASVNKVFTATAAIDLLGPDTRLSTQIRTARPPVAGVVDGDLVLVGGGDPMLQHPEYTARYSRQPRLRTPVEAVADAVVAAGVREIRGRVLGDERRYDSMRSVPTWRAVYLTDHESGPLSALMVDNGFTAWKPSEQPAADPAIAAAAVLTDLLRARGVAVIGAADRVAPDASTPTHLVASIDGARTADLVGHVLRESDNTAAELLLKEVGRASGGAGSTAGGAAATETVLARRGAPAGSIDVIDGSGLDTGNRSTCGALVGLMAGLGPDSAVGRGLAVAGRSGTLARRLVGTPGEGRVLGKTGTLSGVYTIAGHVVVPGRSITTYAYLQNGVGSGGGAAARARQDELLLALVALA